MAPKNEANGIVCKRCGVTGVEHESAYDAIRSGWRLRRVGEGVAKDYQWLCVSCAQSDRPPARGGDPQLPPTSPPRRVN